MTVFVREDVEQGKHSSNAGGSINLYSHFGSQYGRFSENWESFYYMAELYFWAYNQGIFHPITRTIVHLCS